MAKAMKEGLIARKGGMTQVFGEDGNIVPVTVLEAGPCTVVSVQDPGRPTATTRSSSGSSRSGRTSPSRWPGHFKKAGRRRRCGCCARCGSEDRAVDGLPGGPDADRGALHARRAGGRVGRDARARASRAASSATAGTAVTPPTARCSTGRRARSAPRRIPRACCRATSCRGAWAATGVTVLAPRGGARAAGAEPPPGPGRGPGRHRRAARWCGKSVKLTKAQQHARRRRERGQVSMPTVNVLDAKRQGARRPSSCAAAVFGAESAVPLLHQAVRARAGRRRAGTHDTKGRSEVSGGGRKPWRQKGTGRARQGSIRADPVEGRRQALRPDAAELRPGDAARDAARGAPRGRGGQGRRRASVTVVERSDARREPKTKALVGPARRARACAGARRCSWSPSATEALARAARNVPWLTRRDARRTCPSTSSCAHDRVVFEQRGPGRDAGGAPGMRDPAAGGAPAAR